MKKLIAILVASFTPLLALAAFNDVTVSDSVGILLPSNGLTYTLSHATRLESFTVNNASIAFVMQDNSIIDISSANGSSLSVSPEGVCEILAENCSSDASSSSLTLQCRLSTTITITPGAATTCSVQAATTGGSAAAPAAAAPAAPAAPEPEPVVVEPETPAEEPAFVEELVVSPPAVVEAVINVATSVSVGSSSHSVTVSSASADRAIVTIRSNPLTVTLLKDQSVDLDTDGDGKNDLRATYKGLQNGKPQIEFKELKIVVKARVPSAGGCALATQKAYKSSGSPAVYYITEGCTKRAFRSAERFFTYFGAWSDVSVTAEATLGAVAQDALGFMPAGPLYDPRYGALVKIVTDPKVYLLLGDEKYWINSEDVFNGLNYKWNWIEDIDPRLLNKYKTGTLISYTDHHPNYTIVKYADSTKVYRLEPDPANAGKQLKRHVKDEVAFNKLKFRWDRIVTIPAGEAYEDGTQMNGDSTAEAPAEATADAGKYTFTSFLSAGSSGEEVRQLQLKLKELGFFSNGTGANGNFGPTTEQAVKDFQTAKGLPAVGYVGPSTRTALNEA